MLCIGCTKVLGIDGDYVTDETLTGGGGHKATGGTGGTGGASVVDGGGSGNASSGGAGTGGSGAGASGSGGSPPVGGAGAGNGGQTVDAGNCGGVCQAGEKCCSNTCVAPSPLFGCSMTDCTGCTTLPDHATGICTGGACDFQCVSGYQKQGTSCVPTTTGSGGGNGGGGAPAGCSKNTCPQCITALYTPCCQNNGQCGCQFPFAPCFPPP